MFSADGVVSCKKCERIIHTSGKTHVGRARYHFAKKCAKRAYTPAITTSFRPAISHVKVARFQRQFALWFYSTGMAFKKAAHPNLASALGELTPTAVVPSRKQLGTTLLDICYDEARSATMLKLRGKRCTLVSDAWTDTNGKSVVNYVALYEDVSVFLESVYTGSTSHSASFLAADIQRIMGKYAFIDLVAVVTDNTSTN
jgi:hypothetical protein